MSNFSALPYCMLEQLLLQIAQYPQHVPAQPLEDKEAEWYTFTHHKRDGMFEFFHIGLELKLFWLNGWVQRSALLYQLPLIPRRGKRPRCAGRCWPAGCPRTGRGTSWSRTGPGPRRGFLRSTMYWHMDIKKRSWLRLWEIIFRPNNLLPHSGHVFPTKTIKIVLFKQSSFYRNHFWW